MNDLTAPRFVAPTLGVAGLWTVGVWGSRIRLITAEEATDWTNIARIVVSLAFGLALLALAVRARRTDVSGAPIVLTAFSLWMVAVWAPSLLSVAAGDSTTVFKFVHIILAVMSMGFGAALAGHARREVVFSRAELSRAERRSTRPQTAAPGTSSST